MKIIYFTGTGNSLFVAKHFKAELLSIPQMIKNNKYLIEDDVVGIVYPVYTNSVPDIVKKYLSKCKIKAKYTFVIGTYGFNAGGSLNEMKRILNFNGNKADYYETLCMVDNYLPFFKIEKELSGLKEKNIENNLNHIIEEINIRVKKSEDCGFFYNLVTFIADKTVGKIKNYIPNLFSVNDNCIGCGICKNVCPVSNIVQQNKEKPIFGKKCESCLSCIHNCPKGAIQLALQRSKTRFRNSEISLNEIIESNKN